MTKPNFENRTLFHGDNLRFLRAMNSECVDLIATDPPFNKGRDFHATPDSLARGAKFQDRWSWERDVHQEWVDQITDDHPRLMEAIESARYAHSDGMGAYMCFMAVRLLEMRRILKPSGSIYLHCDPTASHYLKAVMDAIFGWQMFLNEIVWGYGKGSRGAKAKSRQFARNNDILLYYCKDKREAKHYPVIKDIRHRIGQLPSHIRRDRSGYFKTSPRGDYTDESIEKLRAQGRIYETRTGNIRIRYPLKSDSEYVFEPLAVGTVWTDIPDMMHAAKEERTGYPTQKPLALVERMILSSSKEGDVVCDPFCGCATTLVAAEKLQRQWIGVDIWEGAYELVEERLSDESGLFGKVTFTGELPEREDDGEAAAPFLRVRERVPEPDGPRWTRAEMYEYLLEQKGPKCMGCDRTFDDPRYLELDHNTPRSDGGMNHISNRILLCSPCNRLKSNTYTLSGLRRQNRKLGYMSK